MPPKKHAHPIDAHVHFDEVEIAEYDKTRGQHVKITDPKTPYAEFNEEIYVDEDLKAEDHEMTHEIPVDQQTLKLED